MEAQDWWKQTVSVIALAVPALGAVAGYHFLKNKKLPGGAMTAIVIGSIGATLLYGMIAPITLYRGALRNSGAYAPIVVTGMQASGAYIF